VGAGFELLLDVQCATGESPVWDTERAVLLFVDIPGRRLYNFEPQSGKLDVLNVEEDIGCVAAARGGGYVAGLRSGIWLLDAAGAKRRLLAENPENQATSRFNDGRVDPRGRYLSGTLDESKKNGNAGLYRCDSRGLDKLTDGLMTSNGLAFSPDGRTLYYSDTPRFVIYQYDYDPNTGAAVNRREFARIEPTATDRGRPDGAAVDSEGCYWSSMYDGGRIHRYDPDGRLMSVHPVPVRCPTMPAFGGDDLKTVFVTTARQTGAAAPVSGSPSWSAGGGVYSMPAPVAGLANPVFDPAV
jgi:sugar lactone lactonase YvrE